MRRAAAGAQGTSPVASDQLPGVDDRELDGLAVEAAGAAAASAAEGRGAPAVDSATARPAVDADTMRLSTPRSQAQPGADPDPRTERMFNRWNAELAEKLVVDPGIAPTSLEQYRRLAAVLHDAQAVSGLKVVMIASAMSGEGKTLTAANLALTLSGSYRKRVLLMDADLRRPAVHQVFRLETSHGLADGLDTTREPHLVVRQISRTLSILPAGRPTVDPMAALISGRMKQLVGEARDTFEWVIIDTPPLVLLPDANLLASMVDGVVLVIKAGSTSHELTKRAVEAVGRPRIVGVVLNRAARTISDQAEYYDYYTASRSSEVATT
jgi:capsular exopolysaccharide synthesis family protein